MLKAVTKKVIDRSTDKFFKFEFYCDRCGKKLTSKPYYFEHSFSDRLTDGEKKAKEIIITSIMYYAISYYTKRFTFPSNDL